VNYPQPSTRKAMISAESSDSAMQAGTSMAHTTNKPHISPTKQQNPNHAAPISNPTTQKTKQKKTNKTTILF
jgi:hypothetical protein